MLYVLQSNLSRLSLLCILFFWSSGIAVAQDNSIQKQGTHQKQSAHQHQPQGIQKVSPQKIKEILSSLKGWTLKVDGKAVVRHFKFKDFSQAWAFMSRVALLAEKLNHHPEWSKRF